MKKVFALLTLLSLGMMIVGCGEEKKTTTSGKTTTSAGKDTGKETPKETPKGTATK